MAVRFDVTVEIALGVDITTDPSGWSWTDITDYCMVRTGGVAIRRGRSDWQSTVQPATCQVLLNNDDGRFSRLNPLGAYYGQLNKNTPIRVQACETGGTPVTRFLGFVSAWPPRWEPSETHKWVPVHADGVLRRLQRGQSPAISPVLRAIMATNVRDYWPLEVGGTEMVNAADGKPFIAAIPLSSTAGPPGSAGAVRLDRGRSARVAVRSDTATSWRIEVVAKWEPATFDVGEQGGFAYTATTEDGALWIVLSDPATSQLQVFYTGGGMPTNSLNAAYNVHNGRWLHVSLVVADNGANVDIDLTVTDQYDGATTASTSEVAAFSALDDIDLSGEDDTNPDAFAEICHLAIWAPETDLSAAYTDAVWGYTGEMAHDRYTRRVAEEGFFGYTDATTSMTMGPQLPGTFLDDARQCEAAAQGILYEALDGAVVLKTPEELYNLAVSVVVDYAAGEIKDGFEPDDDDRSTLNDSTVSRTGGGWRRFEQTDGPLGSDPITGVGTYDESPSVNVQFDDQALDVASWRVYVGTTDGYRHPQVPVMFHSTPALLAGWLTCDIGSRITLDNLPLTVGSDTADQILEGYTERINSMEWHAGLTLSPYVYGVGEYGENDVDGTGPDRYGTDGCVLAVAVDDNDVALQVAPGDRRWTTDADDFAPDLEVALGGETVAVSSIANAAAFQTVGTASAVVNTSASPGAPASVAVGDQLFMLVGCSDSGLTMPTIAGWGQLVTLTRGALYGRVAAGTAADTPTVTVTGIGAGDTLIAQIARFTGIYPTDAAADLDAAGTNQPNGSAQNIATPGLTVEHDCAVALMLATKLDDWTSVAGPGTFSEIGEPDLATGDDFGIWWGYQIQTERTAIQADTITVTGGAAAVSAARVVSVRGLQTMTVSARSVNGVVKSHAVDTEVRLAKEAVYAL